MTKLASDPSFFLICFYVEMCTWEPRMSWVLEAADNNAESSECNLLPPFPNSCFIYPGTAVFGVCQKLSKYIITLSYKSRLLSKDAF